MSIARRILTLIAVTLVLVAAGELFNGLNLRQKRLEELRHDTVQLARIAELDMVRILEGTHQLLATLAVLPADSGWDARACAVIQAAAGNDFEYDHIVAVDRLGKVQCGSSGKMAGAAASLTDADLLARIVETGRFSVGSYGLGQISGNGVLRAGYPVNDDTGAVVGAIYAGISVTWLNNAIGQWRLGEDAAIDITDRNGVVVARYPDPLGIGQPIEAALKPLVSAAATGFIEADGPGGVARLYGFVPVNAGQSGTFAVFVGRDRALAFASVNRAVRRSVGLVLIGLTLAALVALLYIRRFLAQPFQGLLATAARWRDGDWSARAGTASGVTEFDRLALAFDTMAAEVSARDQALHHRDAIMEAITRCAAELVTGGPVAQAIPRILRTVGEAIRADRVLVLEAPGEAAPVKPRYAWHGPATGVESGSAARAAAASNLQAPILVDGRPFGRISVDDSRVERVWTPTETHAVSVLADLIGAAITRDSHLEKLSDADAVVRNSPAIVYRLSADVSPARMTYISENVSSLGVGAAELIADPGLYLTLIHPDDLRAVRAAFASAGIDVGATGTLEFRIADASGAYRWVETRYMPSRDASGRLIEVVGALTDVTERKSAEDKLQFANTLLTTIQNTSPGAILVVDAEQRIISFNRQFVEMWRLPAGLLETRDAAAVLAQVASSVKDPDAFIGRVQNIYAHPEVAAQDEVETTDGRFLDRHTSALRTAGGVSLGRVWFIRDITERKRAEAKIIRMSRFDMLTGLANRGVFVEALKKAIGWAHRGAGSFAVLYLDLDHFKDVNDTLGHPVGDLLLREVAERLRAIAGETDTVARFGGDEFAVVLVGIQEPAEAAGVAEAILDALGKPFDIQGNVIRSGASIGIAVYGTESRDAEVLLSHADIALYRAKSEGRGTYRFFTDAMNAEVHARVTMGAELREAIDREQLFLLYQPQVEIKTGRIIGLEALVRWQHPKWGVIGPSDFIPVAESNGLIAPLGAWVMREACRQTRRWLDAGLAPASVGFNLSGLQFKTTLELEKAVAAVLVETGLPPRFLELELTESILMDVSREHNDVLIRLRQMGLRIAIDDFGTGYSSLDYLRRFPVDRIKIAQVFITDLGTAENTAIVKAALSLARALSIEVIVEGVETAAQLELLTAWGCRYVQGYCFAKPLPVTEITALLIAGTIAPAHTLSLDATAAE